MDRNELLAALADLLRDVAQDTVSIGPQAATRLESMAMEMRGPQLPLAGSDGRPMVTQPQVPSLADTIKSVFGHWRTATDKPRARLTPERSSKIRARLSQGYSERELCSCVDGALLSEHHVSGGHLDIVTIMKNGSVVEQHIERARGASPSDDGAPDGVKALRESMDQARKKGDADEWNRLNRQLRDAIHQGA